MKEAETRAELIDPKLLEAAWKTNTKTAVIFHREDQNNNGEIKAGGVHTGKLIADNILEFRNIKIAVIKSKSDELNEGEGIAQALQKIKDLQ